MFFRFWNMCLNIVKRIRITILSLFVCCSCLLMLARYYVLLRRIWTEHDETCTFIHLEWSFRTKYRCIYRFLCATSKLRRSVKLSWVIKLSDNWKNRWLCMIWSTLPPPPSKCESRTQRYIAILFTFCSIVYTMS